MSEGVSRRPGLAAFDFDGTIAKGDSLIPFVERLVGRRQLLRSVVTHAWPLLGVAIGKGNRDLTKEKFVAHAIAGQTELHIKETADAFGTFLATRTFPRMMQRLQWHKDQGHELVLVSASLDVYLEPFAKQLGFDACLTTELELDNGVATGRLVGGNVRAAAKVRRLEEHLGADRPEIWAYGNSSGDHQMLAMADHAFYVDRSGRFTPWRIKP